MNFFGASDPIQNYRAAFPQSWRGNMSVDRVRFVVLDTETTGLDPRKDLIVSIGAVAVRKGEIMLEDQFEALLKVPYNSSTVVVHGVTREASLQGLDEAEGLRLLLNYLRDAVIVGHHIGFDMEILHRRCERRFGIGLENQWLDTGHMANRLNLQGALPASTAESAHADHSLDGLCRRLGISLHDRHTAAGDAFICAQLFIKMLRFATRLSLSTLDDILKLGTPPPP